MARAHLVCGGLQCSNRRNAEANRLSRAAAQSTSIRRSRDADEGLYGSGCVFCDRDEKVTALGSMRTTGHQPGFLTTSLGVVAIGRNEGERLRRCLQVLSGHCRWIVYVDSGSIDDSVATATAAGATVHHLDLSRPFTAARARNEGVRRLRELSPDIEFIQFVDGDCEISGGWLETAVTFLDAHPGVAAVCGRRRERHPERSIYNRLCDIEWDTPVGEAKAFGGDVLMRTAAWQQVGGYRDELIAGEEPELCVRLRAGGWRIWRLGVDMSLHDAAMTRLGQWWMRCVRAGFAYSEGARLHGLPPERHWVRECRSAWLWGAALPIAIVLSVLLISPLCGMALALYPAQIAKVALRLPQRGSVRWARAFFLVAGKFPEAQGLLKARWAQLLQQRTGLIEYK